MKRKTYLLLVIAFFSVVGTSCNVNVFHHEYSSGSYRLAYVDNERNPAGITVNDDDGDADIDENSEDDNSFWVIKLVLNSWQSLFG